MAPTAEITDYSSIDSDEEKMKIDPSNLRTQPVFNTSNINIAVNTSIADAGATGHFPSHIPLSKTSRNQRNLCALTYQMEIK